MELKKTKSGNLRLSGCEVSLLKDILASKIAFDASSDAFGTLTVTFSRYTSPVEIKKIVRNHYKIAFIASTSDMWDTETICIYELLFWYEWGTLSREHIPWDQISHSPSTVKFLTGLLNVLNY